MPEWIPVLDLAAQHRPLRDALVESVTQAIDGTAFIGGDAVDAFESQFASVCKTGGCVGVANGTDALVLALRTLGVSRGDAVILPAFTFIATAEAVSVVGATPRLCDVDAHTYTISPRSAAQISGDGVKAMIPVHLYGQPAHMTELLALAKERNHVVIEDAAQAHCATYGGRPVGSLGDLGCFSFYPGKNLGAMGDAGAVVGSDPAVLGRIRQLGNHGRTSQTEHGEAGINSRLDAIQARALSIKLPHLNDWNAARARVASWYAERLAGLDGVQLPVTAPGRTHVYHLFVVQVHERARLQTALRAAGVASACHYTAPLHLQPAYRGLGYERGQFPVAEALAQRCLSLPMYPELRQDQVDRVVAVLRDHAKAGG